MDCGAASASGRHLEPEEEEQERGVAPGHGVRERPAPGQRPTERPDLDHEQRTVRALAGELEQRRSGLIAEVLQERSAVRERERIRRVHVDLVDVEVVHGPGRVHQRSRDRAHRGKQRVAVLAAPREGEAQVHHELAPQRRRERSPGPEGAAGRSRATLSSGSVGSHWRNAARMPVCIRPGIDNPAAVEIAQREKVELECGHDPEVALAAAHQREQLGFGLGVDPAQRAVSGDDLHAAHMVRREPVGAAQHGQVRRRGCSRRRRRRCLSRAVRPARGAHSLPERSATSRRPPPVAVRSTGSICRSCRRRVLMSRPPSTAESAPCPVDWTATGSRRSAAHFTPAATSCASAAPSTTSGRWTVAALKANVSAANSGLSGKATGPLTAVDKAWMSSVTSMMSSWALASRRAGWGHGGAHVEWPPASLSSRADGPADGMRRA